MMMDIFSNFDPAWFKLCYKNMMPMSLMPLILMSMFWNSKSKITLLYSPLISYMSIQLMTTKIKSMKTALLMTSTMFLLIIYMNILGMVPYLFSVTSHILFTISMSLPTWMFLIISTLLYSMKNSMAHLLPDSAPMWLSPFLVLIELISIVVRPLTLSFRLAANMTAGHVIMNLAMSFSVTHKIKPLIIMSFTSSMYIMFELFICLIQAYIFCLLLSLYSNDHE